MKTFLMTTKMNENIDTGEIQRVNNWQEVYKNVHKYLERKEVKNG